MRLRGIVAASAGALLVAAVLGLVFLSRRAGNEADGVSRLIGVSHANLTEPWRIAMNKDILEAAAGRPGCAWR